MLTVVEAQAAIARHMPEAETERVPTDLSVSRILRQSVNAERDQPPFDRVMMDGIALRFSDFESGQRAFPIAGEQHAGDKVIASEAGQCIEIMTGASMPAELDCVIPVEQITVSDGVATLSAEASPRRHQFIHPRGSDHEQGRQLLRPGHRIQAADVAVIASAGISEVDVSKTPVVRVISTGNELVPAGVPIDDHQIRLSNAPALAAMLRQHGYTGTEYEHLPDDRAILTTRIGQALEEADVLVLSGGVSMGKADFIPDVMKDLGVELVFHRVSQRPGKPMWFGVAPGGKAVFALPGNPVSNMVCGRQYVIPALYRSLQGQEPPQEFASLSQAVSFAPKLTCFLPTRIISNPAGQLIALPAPTNTSGDFASLSGTDGYLELALEQSDFPANSTVPLHRWQHR